MNVRRLLASALVVATSVIAVLLTPVSAQAAVSATVQVSAGSLNVRTGPSTKTPLAGTLPNKAAVSITCAVTGEYIRGNVRSTAAWDRLASGRYISHAYVRTSVTIPTCPAPAPSLPAASTVALTISSGDGPVRLRTGPTTLSETKGTAASGTKLTGRCAVSGEYVAGTVRSTSQWDRLTSGLYVSHAYIISSALSTCAGATAPAPVMSESQFIATAVPGAQQGWREFGVPPSVTIGQAILESGWGRSELAANDLNYFGIKCFGGSPGTIANGCHTYRTSECDPDGTCYPTQASFRTYLSMADSFRDHGYFLRNNSRYQPAFAYTRDANRFLTEIWKAGYATDPEYVSKVQNLMRQYNLYRYDTWS
jgi:uncharacterized protein YraI